MDGRRKLLLGLVLTGVLGAIWAGQAVLEARSSQAGGAHTSGSRVGQARFHGYPDTGSSTISYTDR